MCSMQSGAKTQLHEKDAASAGRWQGGSNWAEDFTGCLGNVASEFEEEKRGSNARKAF